MSSKGSAKRQPDPNAISCILCEKPFNILRKKEQCRRCWKTVCKACLNSTFEIPSGLEVVCSRCGATSPSEEMSTTTSPLSFDPNRIQNLCQSFEVKIMSPRTQNIRAVAKTMMESAKDILPAPFNAVAFVTLKVIDSSIASEINTAECCRLADRISRLTFAVIHMITKPDGYSGANLIAAQLLAAFEDGLKLLEAFRPDPKTKQTVFGFIQQKFAMYSAETAKQFELVHNQLTIIMQDRAFVVSVAAQDLLQPPSIEDIQSGIQRELSHVMEHIKQQGSETGERLGHIETQLQTMLTMLNSTLPAHLRSHDIVYLDPRGLKVNINQPLGEGSSGRVYAGTLYGSIDVAVKVPIKPPSGEDLSDLTQEVQRTVRMAHKNVIKVYGMVSCCSDVNELPVVVMEKLGRTLDNIEGKRLPPQLWKWTTDIITGMDRIHDKNDGIVHFDLKLQNIMLSVDGRTAKVIDFGVSQSKTTVASSTINALVKPVGTVAYMAPEILESAYRGFPCDVYSFAVLLFALWSGKTPWRNFNNTEIATAVRQGSRPSNEVEMIKCGIPQAIIAVIMCCWDQKPGNRPTFRQLMTLDDVGVFWDSDRSRWPSFLAANPMDPDSNPHYNGSSSSYSTMTMGSTYSGATTTATFNSASFVSTGNAIKNMSSEELCLWLTEDQKIKEGIIKWFKEREITGDIFCFSGTKLISKLRADASIDEWHVDSLERCFQRVSASIESEEKREKDRREAISALEAKKQAKLKQEAEDREMEEQIQREAHLAEEQAKREAQRMEEEARKEQEKIKQARQEALRAEEERKREELAKQRQEEQKLKQAQEQRTANINLNMKAVNLWRDIWLKKDPELVSIVYSQHYAADWSSFFSYFGKETFAPSIKEYHTAMNHTLASLQSTWHVPPGTWKVLSITPNSANVTLKGTNGTAVWSTTASWTFEPAGKIKSQRVVIEKAVL